VQFLIFAKSELVRFVVLKCFFNERHSHALGAFLT